VSAESPTTTHPSGPLEIERKYLLSSSDISGLVAELVAARPDVERLRIDQVYLADGGGWNERVRKVTKEDGSVSFWRNRKRKVSRLARIEEESEITADEYARLLAEADSDYAPLTKTRLTFADSGLVWELDLFDRYPGVALLEVELDSEDVAPLPPRLLGPVVEVSEDDRYSSRQLARRDQPFPTQG
jgi:CYTH domain-containing protein